MRSREEHDQYEGDGVGVYDVPILYYYYVLYSISDTGDASTTSLGQYRITFSAAHYDFDRDWERSQNQIYIKIYMSELKIFNN